MCSGILRQVHATVEEDWESDTGGKVKVRVRVGSMALVLNLMFSVLLATSAGPVIGERLRNPRYKLGLASGLGKLNVRARVRDSAGVGLEEDWEGCHW